MKATPAQKRLKSVRYQTTAAIITAGRKNSKTLATTMIMMTPMMKRNSSIKTSARNGKPKAGKSGISSAFYKIFIHKGESYISV